MVGRDVVGEQSQHAKSFHRSQADNVKVIVWHYDVLVIRKKWDIVRLARTDTRLCGQLGP